MRLRLLLKIFPIDEREVRLLRPPFDVRVVHEGTDRAFGIVNRLRHGWRVQTHEGGSLPRGGRREWARGYDGSRIYECHHHSRATNHIRPCQRQHYAAFVNVNVGCYLDSLYKTYANNQIAHLALRDSSAIHSAYRQ